MSARSRCLVLQPDFEYAGSVGGVDLCQVAVHLTFTSSAGHSLIGRRLYFTQQ